MTKEELTRLEDCISMQQLSTDYCLHEFGAESDEYKTACSWYCAQRYLYFVITGKHFYERTADNDCI